MTSGRYRSWGGCRRGGQRAVALHWRHAPIPAALAGDDRLLPFGEGRSYGDCCLNEGGVLLDTKGLDRFIDFDPATGLLRCEAGVTLAAVLRHSVPQGWFIPVTPGTDAVTVGGAIANDVHGKNHHRAGTFGRHVSAFELLRSDGARMICSRTQHQDWMQATVGGLGLTGVVTWAEIELKRIANPYIIAESRRFPGLNTFFELSADSDRDYEYTVAWIDSTARGQASGRGVFMRGNHATGPVSKPQSPGRELTVPLTPPVSLITPRGVKAFNWLYYHRQPRAAQQVLHYAPFFYPLDRARRWNRLYGPRGFFQYQCVVPTVTARDSISELLARVAASGMGSFLSVLKVFGDQAAAGMMSFPRAGVTLTLDFANQGDKTLRLLNQLEDTVRAAGGAVYPAKDACMRGEDFRTYYPQWQRFAQYIDPRFSSSFWRRVMD